jgi:hypothetical protein
MFDTHSTYESYSLSTYSGPHVVSGRHSHGFIITSLDEQTTYNLPTLIECDIIECDIIPNNRHEIPTCDVAVHYPHLATIANLILPLDNTANITLLIGRDLLIRGNPFEPYAQRLSLGLVVIGETCLDGIHTPKSAEVMKTMLCSTSEKPNTSIWMSCDHKMHVSECIKKESLFRRTSKDNQPSISFEDKEFLSQMDSDMKKDSSRHWIAPLPVKKIRPVLPNNRQYALDRAVSQDKILMKNSTQNIHFPEFMKSLFESGHISLAPKLPENTEC